MKLFDLIAMCVRNLTRRKFRTFLTVFGVIIGTTSIVVMISLGVGISTSIEQQLENMGDLTLIQVHPQGGDVVLDDTAVSAIQAMPGVLVAAPRMRFHPDSGMQIYAGRSDRYAMWPDLVGIAPDALEKLGIETETGPVQLGSDPKTIQLVIGPQVPYQFQDTRKRGSGSMIDGWPDASGNVPDPFFDPVQEELVLRLDPTSESSKQLSFPMQVTGVLKLKENDWENRYTTFVALEDLQRIKTEYERENKIRKDANQSNGYEQMTVKVDHIDSVKQVQDAIKEMGFFVSSLEEIRENMQQSTGQIQMILGILGGVALFVAAISITNTMIMSVYERTREIGVMKVLGCLVGNIRTVFLMEAGLIGFFGGVLGIGLSFLLSYGFNSFGGAAGADMGMAMGTEAAKLSIIPPWLVLTGLAVATSIGLLAGSYPANRAVRISALEAIKQE